MEIEASDWIPPQHIRVVVVGIACSGDSILAFWVTEASGLIKGARPPGGGVEFGERTADALAREFREELATGVDVLGPPAILENLFRHQGVAGHEIVYAFPVRLQEAALYRRRHFLIEEPDGQRQTAEWMALDRFRDGTTPLFPDGLLDALPELLAFA